MNFLDENKLTMLFLALVINIVGLCDQYRYNKTKSYIHICCILILLGLLLAHMKGVI
jgi:hypothetical protein